MSKFKRGGGYLRCSILLIVKNDQSTSSVSALNRYGNLMKKNNKLGWFKIGNGVHSTLDCYLYFNKLKTRKFPRFEQQGSPGLKLKSDGRDMGTRVSNSNLRVDMIIRIAPNSNYHLPSKALNKPTLRLLDYSTIIPLTNRA